MGIGYFVDDQSSHKLAFRLFEPSQVKARVGMVFYKLHLPSKALIHPVVHVSLLRQAHPPEQEHDARIPHATTNVAQDLLLDEPCPVLQ
jgi:hypothetical protein